MPRLHDATPQVSVRLYKTISRQTINGQAAVSTRYQGKSPYIDLTPFLGDGSAVNTTKSVREPAGAFSITFADRPHQSVITSAQTTPSEALESIYGLVEPMDVVEIRMWNGLGQRPAELPIKMRGFVSEVQRAQTMGTDGRPLRQVTITGQDYGKIWQMYQVLFLPAYAGGQPLLTNYALSELFGTEVINAMPAADFVRTAVEAIINPHLAGFMPEHSPMPTRIETGDSLSVAHGMVNNSYQSMQGSVYDILKHHGDVGIWNELYTEDREDGVHCVYRATPALVLATNEGSVPRRIQSDAPAPVDVSIPDSWIQSLSSARTDANVANFYWVNNSKFDLVGDTYRKLYGLGADDQSVALTEYPNAAVKYYGTRPMYGETQQGDDAMTNMGGGLAPDAHAQRDEQAEAWIDKRRRLMLEMNRDNVVLERGTARIKGGPMRADGEAMKAGDYAVFKTGTVTWRGYVTTIADSFQPFQSYTTTLTFERGTNFATRAAMEGGVNSPWLAEQSRRGNDA